MDGTQKVIQRLEPNIECQIKTINQVGGTKPTFYFYTAGSADTIYGSKRILNMREREMWEGSAASMAMFLDMFDKSLSSSKVQGPFVKVGQL
ncbi:unnamed protein product [Ilex paraguariensis]|uniref:Uncharacterized protein n=1 Tax=Ilex paraguariensis TaxID=185542 RepID=A0ABC8R976_9AQUA